MVDESIKTGVVTGFLGSLCCVGPLLIVAFGLGSVGFALGFAKYRPFFIILAIVFLFVALYRQIKKKHGVCDLKTIRSEIKTIVVTIIVAAIIWIVLLYVLVPFFARYAYG